MQTKFRVRDSVPDNSVSFGRVEVERAAPYNTVVTYDYSGSHLNNVSTYPDQERLVAVSRSTSKGIWWLTNIFASDVAITNRFRILRGSNMQVPLYFQYTTEMPLVSRRASFDQVNNRIKDETTLRQEYEIVRRNGSTVTDYVHDVEFIPYHVKHGITYDATKAELFYIRIYSNGSKDSEIHKIKFICMRTNKLGTPVETCEEYISVDRIMDLHNINYEFQDGIGADLLGHSYEGSIKNPTGGFSDDVYPSVADPDGTLGRPDSKYSLTYHYNSKRYMGFLSDAYNSYEKAMLKPIPLVAIYYAGVEDFYGDSVQVVVSNKSILITINTPGSNSKAYTYEAFGKSSVELATEITNSRSPFTAESVLYVADINYNTVLVESTFDKHSDGAILVRSNYFYAQYTAEPTVKAYPPSANLTNKEAWYARVKFGGFVDEKGNAYYINEYGNQTWSNQFGFPWVEVAGERVFLKDMQTIQCKFFPIFNNAYQLNLTDSTGASMNEWVDGIDSQRGLVFLREGVNPDQEFYISYAFKQQYADVTAQDLNPLPGFGGTIGKFYTISVTPYLTASGTLNSSTIIVTESSELPESTYNGDNLVLGSFLLTNKFSNETDYTIHAPVVYGGGLNKKIPLETLRKKVHDMHSFFDIGYIDGLRYPANSVIMVTLPAFMKNGTRSVVLENYKRDSVNRDEISIYGALNIRPGSAFTIYSGQVGSGTSEVGLVQAPVGPNRVRLQSALSRDYDAGTIVVLVESRVNLFSTEEIDNAMKRFSSAGSYMFTEYRE
jgi:hypothetical protein